MELIEYLMIANVVLVFLTFLLVVFLIFLVNKAEERNLAITRELEHTNEKFRIGTEMSLARIEKRV